MDISWYIDTLGYVGIQWEWDSAIRWTVEEFLGARLELNDLPSGHD